MFRDQERCNAWHILLLVILFIVVTWRLHPAQNLTKMQKNAEAAARRLKRMFRISNEEREQELIINNKVSVPVHPGMHTRYEDTYSIEGPQYQGYRQ